MSVVEEIARANERYYQGYVGGMLPVEPSRRLTVVACMDSRMDIFEMLGLKLGEAHIIRNAGGVVTEDVIRSIIISRQLGTQEIILINHTDCGLLRIREDELRDKLRRESGTDAVIPERFYACADLEENVRLQAQKLRSHPWIPQDTPIHGFVFDVLTGRLNPVRF